MVRIDFNRLRFLVIDDNAHMRRILRTLLHGFGAREVYEAEDGAAGLEAFTHYIPDIVITDWAMTNVKFPNPLFEGDTIHCTTQVVSKRESKSRPGAGIVEFHHKAFKQDGTLVAECHRQAFMRMRPK